MANEWKVEFTDDDSDDIQVASFNSQREANLWIKNQQVQDRYDPRGFEVVDGPYRESMLSEDEDEKGELTFKAFAEFAENLDLKEVQQAIIDAAIVFISNALDVDAQKFKDENPKLCKKLCDIIPVSKDESDKVTPIFAVNYPSTDVNILAVVNIPWMQDKSAKSFFKLGWKLIKKVAKNYTPLGTFIKDSGVFLLIPFKQEGDKIVHDTSENAYLQVAMTLLLSDIEFDSLWPTKSFSSSFMKYLDFICPSVLDILSLATFGGASIAARAAKISAKLAAKGVVKSGAKAGVKAGLKKLSRKQLKLIAKLSKNAPKSVQKTIKSGHKVLKKAKNMSVLSRKMKHDLKGRAEDSQEDNSQEDSQEDNSQEELAESIKFSSKEYDIDESAMKTKIWVDDIRPAPEGYIWIKSVNSFIDYIVEHGIEDVAVFDFDHDAGDYANDGGDYIKCLDYLESIGADNINVRIHSANPVGAQNMRQIIQKNQWNEVNDIFESTLSREQQMQMLFESIGPSDETFGEKWEQLDKNHYAWKTIEDSLIDDEGLHIGDVCKVEGKDYFIGILYGGDNGSSDPQKWLRYLESVKKLIAQMFKHGCGDVWLVDFNNDCLDDVFTLRIGFQMLSSPFSSDGNASPDDAVDECLDGGDYRSLSKDNQLDEDEELVEQEDSAKKDQVVSSLKKAEKDFQNAASNNDPEQFAKIVVAFDDLISGVGAYDFKKKKELTEDDIEDCNNLISKDMLDVVAQKMRDAGADVQTIEIMQARKTPVLGRIVSPSMNIHGKFDDRFPLDMLCFHWHDKDENADAGWYEGTRCMNKWRGIGKDILDELLPNGWPKLSIDMPEQEDDNGD